MDPFLNILHPNGTCLSKKSLQSLQSAKEIGCCTLLMMSRVVVISFGKLGGLSRRCQANEHLPNAFSGSADIF